VTWEAPWRAERVAAESDVGSASESGEGHSGVRVSKGASAEPQKIYANVQILIYSFFCVNYFPVDLRFCAATFGYFESTSPINFAKAAARSGES